MVFRCICSLGPGASYSVAADDDLAIRKKAAEKNQLIGRLKHVFEELDESGDGILTRKEFDQILTDNRMKTWLSALEVDVTELVSLFSVLDDGDGEISIDEFIHGVSKARGHAKAIDVLTLLKHTVKLDAKIDAIVDTIESKMKDANAPPSCAVSEASFDIFVHSSEDPGKFKTSGK
eukprot:gnl/TRDRNA2_/TRDRNA2_163385_c1_seq2.p2 gnl/TRDRNA2_/TRDRNA2_163385_c1~~gnl/TRDRNA2_/TRDRNA2_163385_c1_seq2.p2  ORF type:complete len:177 (-),score=36.04 gnl/TRDRNA2_/TRDRNA2_163385_c1_seq2:155-685(-)